MFCVFRIIGSIVLALYHIAPVAIGSIVLALYHFAVINSSFAISAMANLAMAFAMVFLIGQPLPVLGGMAYFQALCLSIKDMPCNNPITEAVSQELWSMGKPNYVWMFSIPQQGWFDVYPTKSPYDPVRFWFEDPNERLWRCVGALQCVALLAMMAGAIKLGNW